MVSEEWKIYSFLEGFLALFGPFETTSSKPPSQLEEKLSVGDVLNSDISIIGYPLIFLIILCGRLKPHLRPVILIWKTLIWVFSINISGVGILEKNAGRLTFRCDTQKY